MKNINELFEEISRIYRQENILICYFSFFDKNKTEKFRIYATKKINGENNIFDEKVIDENGKESYKIYDSLECAISEFLIYLKNESI